MDDNKLETVAILAGLISEADTYFTDKDAVVVAVPVHKIASVLEKFVTTQSIPTKPEEGAK